jgi:hypothetical protein
MTLILIRFHVISVCYKTSDTISFRLIGGRYFESTVSIFDRSSSNEAVNLVSADDLHFAFLVDVDADHLLQTETNRKSAAVQLIYISRLEPRRVANTNNGS